MLALIACGLFLGLKSRHKLPVAVSAIVGGVVAENFYDPTAEEYMPITVDLSPGATLDMTTSVVSAPMGAKPAQNNNMPTIVIHKSPVALACVSTP